MVTVVDIMLVLSAVTVLALFGFAVAMVISCFRREWEKVAVQIVSAVILFIVAGILLPNTAKLCQRHGRVTLRCRDNLSKIWNACNAYSLDHGEAFPSSFSSLTNYLADPAFFVCPSTESQPGPIETVDQWADYVLVTNLTRESDPNLALAYCTSKYQRGGKVVVLVGGSTTFVGTKDFEAMPYNISKHARTNRSPQQ